jgi:Tfp pilus assembly protein PilO
MMLVQGVPDVPPIPFDPNSPALMMMVLALFAALTIICWPIARAIARRLEGKHASIDPAIRQELEQLHQRIAEVDALQHRVGELEERLDFAERLLARTDVTTAQLPRGQA